MLTSLAFIFLAGLLASGLCRKLKLPTIIGMLVVGMILGPFGLGVLDDLILGISADLRKMALIIILIKAGLSLDIGQLKKVGRPALLMSFVPASFEILGFFLLAPYVLHITRAEALVMGSVLAAVSPAVVVPRMVNLMETGYGAKKSIPQMILAGASLDDIFVIVLFSTAVSMAQGGQASVMDFVNIPVSIVLGIIVGALVGWVLSAFLESRFKKGKYIRGSVKVIIIISISFLLVALEDALEGTIAISGLLAVMSMACVIRIKCNKGVTLRLSEKFGKLWLAAELLLFVLVGAAVDIRYTAEAGISVAIMIFLALIFRSVGVTVCMIGTQLTLKEKIFCVIAYLPKATVQAAIGSVPLAMGLPCGKIVLSAAVLAILITAPLGAAGIDMTYKKLLVEDYDPTFNNEN